jgi:hypothetical protein
MVTIRTVEDAYQMALKAEEKLSRKQGTARPRQESAQRQGSCPRTNTEAQGGLEEASGKG